MTDYGNTELGKRAKEIFGEGLFEKPVEKAVLVSKIKGYFKISKEVF